MISFGLDLEGLSILLNVLSESLKITALCISLVLMMSRAKEITIASAV